MTQDEKRLHQLRKDALDIFHEGLKAVDPVICLQQYCRLQDNMFIVNNTPYDLDRYNQILVLGAGKASAAMGRALENILKDRITQGLIIVKHGHGEPLAHLTVVEASHPIPDKNGLNATQKLLALAQQSNDKTLVICLISGGGSALMPLPAEHIQLTDKQTTTKILLSCGATIHEINTIRKHLSQIKGGRLAKAVYPSDMVCMVLSDVVGDDLSVIASGPAIPDPTTYEQCLDIIHKYRIEKKIPDEIITYLTHGRKGIIPETPKPDDPLFGSIDHTVIANNITALLMARERAKKLGYSTLLLSSLIQGETRDVAKVHTAIAKEIIASGHPVSPPACVLSGGETTVTLKGNGKGGRNQEFALACALGLEDSDHTQDINDNKKTVILSCGTDGTDGPTDAAGAVVDGTTIKRARRIGIDPDHHLENNDAYPFFEQMQDLIKTGPTRTNVMDIRILLIR